MEWQKENKDTKLTIKSWCAEVDDGAMEQSYNLANHPILKHHVALMPDCHVGYGMPIGGVIASKEAVIPNAVGVDIGCGMCAVQTNFDKNNFKDKSEIRAILNDLKKLIPVGEGNSHKSKQEWERFSEFLSEIDVNDENIDYSNHLLPGWLDKKCWDLAAANLGTLGGGNHFIEMQKDQENRLWLMLHSGSRNLGHRIASFYHGLALQKMADLNIDLPDKNLAFLYIDSTEGQNYIRDMNFALSYALENRKRMMTHFKNTIKTHIGRIEFIKEVNIHHNYASLESHFDEDVWIHRKGATSAKRDELGIIPGSMGTSSYIVKGLGNPESFQSCSHGAGRKMGRMEACRNLTLEECNESMKDVVFDRWKNLKKWGKRDKNIMDFGEAPLAYKDIDQVIQAQLDLIQPVYKLEPLGVVKG